MSFCLACFVLKFLKLLARAVTIKPLNETAKLKTQLPMLQMGHWWILSAVLLLIASIFSSGFHHYDEHYHILEFIAFKLGKTSADVLPWEFGAQIRSWLLPGFFYLVLVPMRGLGIEDPLIWATLFRLFGAALNLCVLWFLFEELKSKESSNRFRVAGLLSVLWFFPYIRVRTSIENWSGALFFLGFVASNRNHNFLTGMLWGLAFQIRLQIAPLIAGAILWQFIIGKKRTGWFRFGVGGLLALLIGVFTDRWGYGAWTIPWFNYLNDQFTHQRATTWGTSPVWYYVTEGLIKGAPPISILIVGSILLSWWYFPKHQLTWITLPFILSHTIEPHKELRFMFPMLMFVPLQMGLVAERLQNNKIMRFLKIRFVIVSLIFINLILLLASLFQPAEGRTLLFRYLLDKRIEQIHWIESDPYELFKMPLNFYKPPTLQSSPMNYSELGPLIAQGNGITLVTTTFSIPLEHQEHCSREFSVLPQWLKNYDWGHWIQRTRVWTVYRCSH